MSVWIRSCGCAGSRCSASLPPFSLSRRGSNSMQRLEPAYAAALLALNITELAALLFFTGGLQNPFSFLFLAPVLISATALPTRLTMALGVFAIACATVLGFRHLPLPWNVDDPLRLPPI